MLVPGYVGMNDEDGTDITYSFHTFIIYPVFVFVGFL